MKGNVRVYFNVFKYFVVEPIGPLDMLPDFIMFLYLFPYSISIITSNCIKKERLVAAVEIVTMLPWTTGLNHEISLSQM